MKQEATKPLEENKGSHADPLSRSEFIERLLEHRAKTVEAGIPLLTWEQLDCEMAERRGRESE